MHDADPTAAHDVLDLDPMISRWPLAGLTIQVGRGNARGNTNP
jgi:hypothetical protein